MQRHVVKPTSVIDWTTTVVAGVERRHGEGGWYGRRGAQQPGGRGAARPALGGLRRTVGGPRGLRRGRRAAPPRRERGSRPDRRAPERPDRARPSAPATASGPLQPAAGVLVAPDASRTTRGLARSLWPQVAPAEPADPRRASPTSAPCSSERRQARRARVSGVRRRGPARRRARRAGRRSSAAPLRRLSATTNRSSARSWPRVAADAPDEDVVLAVGVDRHRVDAGGRVVDDGHAGRGLEQLAGALGAQRLARLDVDRLGVAVDDRHAHARRRLTRIVGSPRILRVSLMSLRSSSVWSSPAANEPACGSALKAIWCA